MMALFNRLKQSYSRYYTILWLVFFMLPSMEILGVANNNQWLLSGLVLLQLIWIIGLCILFRRWIPTVRLRSQSEDEEKVLSWYLRVHRIIYYSGLSFAMSMPMSIIFIASRHSLYKGIASVFFLMYYHIGAGCLLNFLFSWQLGMPSTIVLTISRRRIIAVGCIPIVLVFLLTFIFWDTTMKWLMIGISSLSLLTFTILVMTASRYFQKIENESQFSCL